MTFLRIFVFLWMLPLGLLAQGKGEPYVKDEVLIKFRASTSRSKAIEATAKLGLAQLERLGNTGWQRVKISNGSSPKKAAASALLDPDIEFAQPNFYYYLQATPNDPQWGVAELYGLPKIGAPAAWDLTTGSSTVVIANIDTGMRYTHEDLAANMWTNPGEIQGNGVDDDNNGFADDYYGYDFFFNDPDPLDEHGHGTHVGGTIGAAGNNALGVVGVNWNVRIMAIKIFNATGQNTTTAMVINAYDYVRSMKQRGINIKATNNSYSGTDESDRDLALKEAIDELGNAGILNVFAAGNNKWNNDTITTPAFPASFTSPSILAVASSDPNDNRSGFSNYGAISVDIAAPGHVIQSTTNGSNSSYGIMSGTSMAAPHVTGAAALLAAFDPSLSAVALKATLMNTVDLLFGWESTPIKTNGRLNVSNALQNRTTCSLTLSHSSVSISRKGGYVDIGVTTGPNCDFGVSKDSHWIYSGETENVSGSGNLRVFVKPSDGFPRAGQLNIGSQSVKIRQGNPVSFPKS